jgi:hypothetical protein
VSDEPDDIQEMLQAVHESIANRTFEMIDYAMIRLEDDLLRLGKEAAEDTFRTIVRALREQADAFESRIINNEEFWAEFAEAQTELDEDDEDDDLPYWGGSNEHN